MHATRSAQIDAAVGPGASPQARAVAARATRDAKVHESVEDLMPRWRHDLARGGYPVPELSRSVERAALAYEPPSPAIVEEVAPQLLGTGGRLASEKTFTRRDVVVAVAPHLRGLPVSYLDAVGGPRSRGSEPWRSGRAACRSSAPNREFGAVAEK